jgi:hypothetical protein
MVTLHGTKVNLGDRVWEPHIGWDVVTCLHSNTEYRIETNYGFYTIDGKYHVNDTYPTLFWNEVKIPKEAFIKPLPINTKVLVWDDDGMCKKQRYFSHFDSDGWICCFNNGTTSWTTRGEPTCWKNWELYKEAE